MDQAITIEEIQRYIGFFWLENKKQADKIKELEQIIETLTQELKEKIIPPVISNKKP